MKKKYLIGLLLAFVLLPFKVFAAGGFGVSHSSISMYPGESKAITITTNNAVGKLNISTSNGVIASVSPGSIFIQNPGSSGSITITGHSIGTATISVVASSDFATMDEEILAGQTKRITVNVIPKPTPTPIPQQPSNPQPTTNPKPTATPKPSNPTPSTPQDNLSKNNNINDLSIEGYEIVKVDGNNYTLSVTNDVTSINVNAIAEDSKAIVTGIGAHELQVGENNIEVIITSESGAKNKINIKVTRKDGYYLEDLPLVLENNNLEEADIIINADSKITEEQLNQIKDSKKILRLNYYDENKKLIYTWTINGNELKDVKELTTTITYTSDNIKEIYELSNYADGLYINFNHGSNISKGIKIKLYIGDKFENNSLVNIYKYDSTENKLNYIKGELEVTDGYIEFSVEDCSEYFVTMATIGNAVREETSSINIFMVLAIIELIIIISQITFIFIKLVPTKKNSKNDYEKTNINITNPSNYNDVNDNVDII